MREGGKKLVRRRKIRSEREVKRTEEGGRGLGGMEESKWRGKLWKLRERIV